MIIYGSSMSPFVRKALAFAAEKGVAVESLPGGMGGGSPAFKAASPFGKIPALEDGDFGWCGWPHVFQPLGHAEVYEEAWG